MADAPVCRTCGAAHWRFVKCTDAAERAVLEATNTADREQRKVRVQWRHDLHREVRFAPDRDPLKVYPVWQPRTTTDGPKAA